MSNDGNGNWPVVPIFGRRKRPRQAFYASPSQDIYKTENLAQKKFINEIHRQNNNEFKHKIQSNAAPIEDDILLDDFNCEDIMQNDNNNSIRHSKQSYSEKWLTRGAISQTSPNVPLKKHPRNNFKEEIEFKFTKENEENTNANSYQEQRKENISPQKQMKIEKPKLQKIRSSVPRVLTLTIEDVKEILGNTDIIFALYEVYGVLHSQVISTNGQCTKQFIIRDSSGTLQCIFWEIDRPLPYIRRGALIRCVGRLLKESFQCLSIRTANHAEIDNAKTLQKQSREVIKSYLLTCKEY